MRGGSLRSGVGNRESPLGNRESGIGNRKSGWLGRGGGCWLWRWMPVIRAGHWPASASSRRSALARDGLYRDAHRAPHPRCAVIGALSAGKRICSWAVATAAR
ncbi:hypothetical protein EIQ03_16830 [Xanthomonas campestris pv. raphani]